ncbi:MAG TPA: hypothetical protein VGW38_10085, partial [Chloroflexota bacterium]|nr:hypothetical protein [Chloroflexota bacterium]
LLVAQGDYERAVRLTGAVAALQEIHRGQSTRGSDQMERFLVSCREALSASTYDAAIASGSGMTLQQAIEFALTLQRRGAHSVTGSHLLECIER